MLLWAASTAAGRAARAHPSLCWAASQTCQSRVFVSKPTEVDELNRELADVFGVPQPPDGTCLGPTQSLGTSDGFGPLPGTLNGDAACLNSDWHHSNQQQQQEQQQHAGPQLPALLQGLQQQLHALQQQVSQLQQQARVGSSAWQPPPPHQPPPQGTAAVSWADASSTLAGPPPHPQQPQPGQQQLSHVDASGRASMVCVGGKPASSRVAGASCVVLLGEAAFAAVAANAVAKGDVLRVAQLAGIQAAKLTPQLVPLCHSIALSSVDVDLALDPSQHAVRISATARASGQTGIEMEALTAAGVAALTVYDMTKAVSKGITISGLRLEFKSGGKSGAWQRSTAAGGADGEACGARQQQAGGAHADAVVDPGRPA